MAGDGVRFDHESMLARMHACEGDELVDAAAAFAAMWRQNPALRPLDWPPAGDRERGWR